MNNGKSETRQEKPVVAGGGFVIACLFGLFGVAAGVILWLADASLPVIVLAYLGFPSVMIVILYFLTLRRKNTKGVIFAEERHATASKEDGRGQV